MMLSIEDYWTIRILTLCVDILAVLAAGVRCHHLPIYHRYSFFYIALTSLFFFNFLADLGAVTMTYFNPLFTSPVKSLVFNTCLTVLLWLMILRQNEDKQ